MRLEAIAVRGFRNLNDAALAIPEGGVAILGTNGQGKTNLLEAIYYPVLFRSLRGAADAEVARFGGPGFQVDVTVRSGDGPHRLQVTWLAAGRQKRIEADGVEQRRLTDAAGIWLAVAFLPEDVRLASGPPGERRKYLDRMLALADRPYLVALVRYRAALAQRNAALRQGQWDVARAFDGALAEAGARVVAARLAWVVDGSSAFAEGYDALGERGVASLAYHGASDLADAAAWAPALEEAAGADRARRLTTVGPHRDDLRLQLRGRSLRNYGSTGQQRSAAIALKLVELGTLARARGEEPALLLDDVFAELDRERQTRLAVRLGTGAPRQTFLTAPRRDELPDNLGLVEWVVDGGKVLSAG